MNTLEYYLSKGGAQGIIQRDAERRKNDRAERERLEEKQRQKEAEEQQTKKAQDFETAMKMRAPWSPRTGTAAARFRSEQAEQRQREKQRLIDTAKAVSKNPEEVKKTLTDLIPQDRQKAMYDKYRRKVSPAVKKAMEDSSAAYILGKTGLGTAESMQGITKLPNILSDAIQEGVPAITNMIKNPPSEKQNQYEYVVNNDGTVTMMKDIIEKQARQQAAKKYTESHSKKRSPADYTTDEAIEDLRNVLAEAEQKGSPAPKWIGDTAQAVGGMLPSILMNAALPGLGQAQMAGSVLGNTYDENRREGNDYVNSLLNAGANAGSELALESLLGVLGEGATAGISKLSPKLSKAIADNPKLQKIIASYPYRVIENAAGEGLEEAIQEPVSLMIDSATGKKATAEDLKQLPQNMLYSGAIGGLTGAGFGSVTNLGAAERPRLNLRKTNAAGELIQNNANVQNISGMSKMEPLQDKIRFEKGSVPNVKPANSNEIQIDFETKIRPYSEHEAENLSKNNYVLGVNTNFDDFINKAVSGNTYDRLYIGKVPQSVSESIKNKFDISIDNYSYIIASDEIRKIFKDHGSDTEALRGQQSVTKELLGKYIDVLQAPDRIILSGKKTDDGKAVFLFEKEIDGRMTAVQTVNDKRKGLFAKTFYVGKNKKGTYTTAIGFNQKIGSNPTPEAVSGSGPFESSISQNSNEVKREKVRADVSEEARQRWTAENKNDMSGRKRFHKSIGDIVKYAEDVLDIPISTGKMGTLGRGASGFYKTRAEAVRTRVANNLPTICHEIGHHFDKKYNISSLPNIQQAIDAMDADFRSKYSAEEIPGEAVAEFMRAYLRDRETAAKTMPDLTRDFEKGLSANELRDIRKIGDMVNSYMTADEAERLSRAVVSRTDRMSAREIKSKSSEMPTKAYIAAIDDLHILKLIDEAAKKNGTDNVVGKKSSYTMAMNSRDSDARVNYIITEALTDFDGNRIGDGLSDIVASIGDEKSYDDFKEYLVARHAAELSNYDIRSFGDDIINDNAAMRRRAAEFENTYPTFKQAAEKVYSWTDKLMRAWLVDTGMISEKQYNAMHEKYPDYVPFFRKVDTEKSKNGKGGFSGQSAGVRKIKGSGLEIYDPIENLVIKTDQIIKAVSKNEAAKAVANICDTAEGMGTFMERIPPEMAKKSVNTRSVKEELSEALENKGVADAFHIVDGILDDTITQWSETGKQRDDVITVMDGGERKYYQVHDKRLLNALTATGRNQLGPITAFLQCVTRKFSSVVTGSNPLFMPSNAIRDIRSASIYTAAKNPVQFWKNYGKAFVEQIKNSEDYQLYKAMGGKYSSNLSQSTNILRRTMREIQQINPNMAKRAANVIMHPIESINALNDMVETAPRLAEFKSSLENGKDVHEAHHDAKNVTLNFQRHGAKTGELRAVIPFWNATLQGADKAARSFKDSPVRTMVRMFAVSILPSLLSYAWNNRDDESKKAYQRLSSYTKNNFRCIYIGNNKFITLPKSQELELPATLIERTLEKCFGGNEEAFYDFGTYILSMLPGHGIEDIVGIGTMYNLGKNEDFKGSPIVPASMEDLEKRQQYDENTTWVAKTLGDIFNLSPKQIDYVVNSATGGIGQVNKALGTKDKDITLGLRNKFVRSSLYSTDVLNKLYDEKDTAMVDTKSHPEDAEKAYIYKRYTNATKITGELGRLAKNAENTDEAQNIKNMQLSYAEKARKMEYNLVDNAITELAKETDATEIFYTPPDNSVKYDKQTYTMPAEVYLKYAEECEQKYYEECTKVLESYGNLDSDKKVKKLEAAKKKARESVQKGMKDEIIQKGRTVFEQKRFQ